MIACVRDGKIIVPPCTAPQAWFDPDTGITYTGFYNLNWPDMQTLGWVEVVDIPKAYDPTYEGISISDWRYDPGLNIVTRDYTVSDRPVSEVKPERLYAVRSECKTRILSVIDIGHQLDVALGIIPDRGYTDWIAAMITESNRCEDLCEAAASIDDLKAIIWNFPEYTGGV